MNVKTAEYNFNLINKHPNGNFYLNKKEKIVEISKWNLIGRLIKYCKNRNGAIRRKVNSAILETLQTVNKTPDQKQTVLSKLSKSRGISLQLLDQKVQNLQKPVTTPTVTMPITGFANGGNTCYLAAALQVLRNIPVVHEHLDRKAPLEKRLYGESDVTLSLRQKAKDHIALLINTIDRSQPVSRGSMKELEKMYAVLNPSVTVGKGHKVFEVFNCVINLVLDIRSEGDPLSVMLWEQSEEEGLKTIEGELYRRLSKNEEIPKILPLTRTNRNTPHFSLQDVITLTADGKKYSYQLVGTVRHSGFHAVAYLRDHQQKMWVACNDAKIHRIDSLKSALLPKLMHAYYTLIE